MQQGLRGYGQRLAAHGRQALEARIGVNTGEVVVRTIEAGGRTEYTPIGHTHNLASRLQALAPTGSIVISEQTSKLVEGYFELRGLGPTQVKGVSEPIDVYEVTGLGPLRSHFQLAARRGLTRFVGRERELAEMKRALELARSGQGQLFAAVADAGTGKSRLFYEFKAALPAECKLFEPYSVSHGKASAWLPVLELLRGYFGIQDADDAATRRQKVSTAITALDPTFSDALPYVCGLLAIQETPDPLVQMDPQVRRRRTLDAIKRIIIRESVSQPVVVIFEDLHWVDGETQALLELLVDSIANSQVLMLVNYRPEYRHEWANKSYYSQVRLDALGRQSASEMLSALLGEGIELVPLKRLVTDRTEGNPFFIEEMVRALFDEGALIRNGMVKVTRSLSQLRLPPTVQGILASRIDRLSAEEKELLQTLAVMGRESPLGLIGQVWQHPSTRSMALAQQPPGAAPLALSRNEAGAGQSELERMLAVLQASEFIYEHPAIGDTEYVFKHALTQEVAYNSLLFERRKVLHERAGQVLESVFAEHLDDYLGELARHYGQSANISKALEYLGRAGQQAMQRCSYPEAISDARAGLELAKHLPLGSLSASSELPLQVVLGVSLMASKGWAFPEVERAFSRARALCEQMGEVSQLAPVLWGIWGFYAVRGEFRTALKAGGQLAAMAERTNDRALLTAARYVLAVSAFWLGEFEQAQTHFERLNEGYELEQHRPLVALFGIDCGIVGRAYAGFPWFSGYPDRATAGVAQEVKMAREVSHPESMAWALLGPPTLHWLCGNIAQTLTASDKVLEYCNEHGLVMQSALAGMLRAWAVAAHGETELGITLLRQGLEAGRTLGLVLMESGIRVMLADTYLRAGRSEEGLISLEEELTSSRSEEKNFEAELARLHGALLLERARIGGLDLGDEAAECFRRAIDIAQAQGAKSWELRATTSLARLLDKQGRRDEARTMLSEIYGWFTEGFDTADLKESKALLEELSS